MHLDAAEINKETVCVFCFDPRHFTTSRFGSIKTGIFRSRFLLESVSNLRKNLKSIGQELIVAHEAPEECIPRLLSGTLPGSKVFVQGEVTSEELSVEHLVEERIKAVNGELIRVYGGNSLYHPDDLPFNEQLSDLPDVFTAFRERVEKDCKVRPLLPSVPIGGLGPPPKSESFLQLLHDRCNAAFMPDLTDLSPLLGEMAEQKADARGVMHFEGGEDAALQRVEEWMFKEDNLKRYFDIRNGMLGQAYSSKLSPWLALGCISPRFHFLAVIIF